MAARFRRATTKLLIARNEPSPEEYQIAVCTAIAV
jgi:hypothetical protein